MRPIRSILLALLTTLTLLWLLSMDLSGLKPSYFSIRYFVVQYSGVLLMGIMSVAMVLALRLPAIERITGGLDKAYRLHKWLGIATLVVGALHWYWAKGTKYLVRSGILERPQRGARPELDPASIEALLRSQKKLAEIAGEWAFYLLLGLLVLSLLKRVRYSLFRYSHKLIAATYLIFVFHSVVLLRFDQWLTPNGIALALLMTLGSVAAVVSLFDRIGRRRRVHGQITQAEIEPDPSVIRLTVDTHGRWPGHRDGQFAYLGFKGESPHPYTLSASDRGDGKISFSIKALGDHTTELLQQTQAGTLTGQCVTVEGPYGQFGFDHSASEQIWIAGGIGLAAFTARLDALAHQPAAQKQPARITLFYCTRAASPESIAQLESLAQQAGIQLKVIDSAKRDRLDVQDLDAVVTDWQDTAVWFCGPTHFGLTLKAAVRKHNARIDFHRELFEMR
ncbi:ferredoxin reductase family protein [Ferrimonas pelagia]|uniref:Ferric reductase-like transmembrane domain-containing protein n=1 Tax=Ferrimonas pelagia TaxID=1177826 RepID=A0ABP9F3T7_9GAMM